MMTLFVKVKSSYGENYFKRRVEIMTNFMTGGCRDVWPVIDAYTNALLDVWPQKRYTPAKCVFCLGYYRITTVQHAQNELGTTR